MQRNKLPIIKHNDELAPKKVQGLLSNILQVLKTNLKVTSGYSSEIKEVDCYSNAVPYQELANT